MRGNRLRAGDRRPRYVPPGLRKRPEPPERVSPERGFRRARRIVRRASATRASPAPRAASALLIDVLRCPRCGDRRRVLAAIHDPPSIAKVLGAMGLSGEDPLHAPGPFEVQSVRFHQLEDPTLVGSGSVLRERFYESDGASIVFSVRSRRVWVCPATVRNPRMVRVLGLLGHAITLSRFCPSLKRGVGRGACRCDWRGAHSGGAEDPAAQAPRHLAHAEPRLGPIAGLDLPHERVPAPA